MIDIVDYDDSFNDELEADYYYLKDMAVPGNAESEEYLIEIRMEEERRDTP